MDDGKSGQFFQERGVPDQQVPRSLWRDLAILIALPVLILPVLVSVRYRDLFHEIGNNPILSFAIAGAFVVHVFGLRSRRELAVTLLLAIILRSIYARLTGEIGQYFGSAVIHWGSFLGISSLIVLAAKVAFVEADRRKQVRSDLLAGGMFFYYWILIGIALLLTAILIPQTYDGFLYAFDSSLGIQPSFKLAQWLLRNPILSGLTQTVYYAIPLAVALLYATQRAKNYTAGFSVFPLLVAASVSGYLLYYIVPGTGPVYAFRDIFPSVIPPAPIRPDEVTAISGRAVRNAMPSLHLGTALIVAWNCGLWPIAARIACWLFLGLTGFATLALGQHYVIDLVVAFPLMLACHAGAMTSVSLRMAARWIPIAAGISITLAWLLMLRLGIRQCVAHPVLSWTLAAATVVGSCALEQALKRAAAGANQAHL